MSVMKPLYLVLTLGVTLFIAPGCSGGDSDGTDAAVIAIDSSQVDADPNAPDADPNAPDADPNAPDADPNAPDADPAAPDAGFDGVQCGTEVCDSSQDCCVMGVGSGTCVAAGTCGGTTVECDGAEDCTVSGEVCCGSGGGAACADGATCALELCNSEDDCPAAGETCCALGPAASSCQSFCPGA